MTHVSKVHLERKTLERIRKNLLNILFSKQGGKRILDVLLTPTERIMLAKRLALIVMIERGYSYYEIWKTLKVSTSTIKRMHARLEAGLFVPIQQALISKRNQISFLDLLELIASGGMLSIAGPTYQKRLNAFRKKLFETK